MSEPPQSDRTVGHSCPDLDITDADSWPEFLTVEEVAQILRVTTLTVQKRVAEGFIPAPNRFIGKTARRFSKRALLDAGLGPGCHANPGHDPDPD